MSHSYRRPDDSYQEDPNQQRQRHDSGIGYGVDYTDRSNVKPKPPLKPWPQQPPSNNDQASSQATVPRSYTNTSALGGPTDYSMPSSATQDSSPETSPQKFNTNRHGYVAQGEGHTPIGYRQERVSTNMTTAVAQNQPAQSSGWTWSEPHGKWYRIDCSSGTPRYIFSDGTWI